ncbi:hypothetical protein ABZS66_20965 [Dactylosporangium sp. NPDC005572]|uniref:hypothetical protein n=1 Tax=Dactylosporangium sp. NPDC005572 TaxID=3156889 RepID=UPI00339DE134
MSPRRGGESDKFGNRYEGRWTVRQLLYVLLGQAESVIIEKAGEEGEGAESIVRRRTTDEAHQVKRQIGNANEWQLSDMKNVLRAAADHVEDKREFHFVSIVPARTLDELSDRARRSENVQAFRDDMLTSNDLKAGFKYLQQSDIYGTAEAAWRALRGIHASWPDERDLVHVNSSFAGLLLEGATPQLMAVGLGDLALDNLNVSLDANLIEGLLEQYGLRRSQLIGSPTLTQNVRSALGRWKDSVAGQLLQPVIPRDEAVGIWAKLQADDRVLFVVGAAGGGKSAVTHDVVRSAEAAGWPVLALRLDRVDPIGSSDELGKEIGLSVSPVSALAAVRRDAPSLLVIDQVDAVSFASGRMPASFDVVASVLREASGFPNMRVMLACRRFDVDNDERIRAIVQTEGVSQAEVGPLTDDQVNGAVKAMGLSAETLTDPQRRLLSSPFNLVLLRAVADQANALSFGSSRDLLEVYWDRKRRDCRQRRSPAPRFNDVIGRVVDSMSERQRLAIPVTVLDHDDLAEDAQVLESEHVLVRDGRNYAFFHESFFDYAFARQWIERGQTLVEFLLGSEQDLFRRGQVRQVLGHLHDDDPNRFIEEAEALLLHPQIRFHIKDVVLALLRGLPAPTSDEWAMVKRVIDSAPEFIEPLWLALRTLPWFDRLDAQGEIERLLSGGQTDQARALEVALGSIKNRAERLAQIIGPHAGRVDAYPDWLRWVTRFAHLHTSRALLDLVIDSLRRGEYVDHEHNLWLSTYQLADHEPGWAVDLLSAYLSEQPGAFARDGFERVLLLQSTDHGAIELTTKAADKAPQLFCEALLPYLQKVLQLAEDDADRLPVRDRQFSRITHDGRLDDVGEAVEQGARTALRRLVADNPEAARPLMEQLAADAHETAQWLLYEALEAGDETQAEWAAELLLEGDHRLCSGPSSGIVEAAARLLTAITPHVASETLTKLEQAILQLRVPWEDRRDTGWCMFNLLAAVPAPYLSEPARRRLGELRRRFGVDEPPPRHDTTGGFVQSPIPLSAAERMTDDQWLRAMATHNTDRHDWTTLRGGAHQLATMIQELATADPDRYARLASRLTSDLHVAYAQNILIGLGNAARPGSPQLVFDAIRHVASLGHSEPDRWLAWPLRKHLDRPIPDDIIELLVDRARHSPSPEEDHWLQSTGDSRAIGERIESNGINSARGECAEMLGDILVHDSDGHRTELVAPALSALASDPSVAVRSCVAHLIGASLRHAQPAALAAFNLLIQADDRLLATRHVADLIVNVGRADAGIVEPEIRRMLASDFADVRKVGGQLAAFAGLELDLGDLLETAQSSPDAATREGVAAMCAARLPRTARPDAAGAALVLLANDPDEKVREAVARVAGVLRGEPLTPLRDVLVALINSQSFEAAVDQLLITLERATERIDDLALLCTRRFIAVFGADMGNPATRAVGNSSEVGRLVLRAYEQARGRAVGRSAALDLIDKLLMFGAFQVDELIDAAERDMARS